jgi:hypothetical protein
MTRAESTKFEIRNPKQIQMTKKQKIPNNPDSDSSFWIFPILDLFWPRFVSNFDIRISDFLSLASDVVLLKP